MIENLVTFETAKLAKEKGFKYHSNKFHCEKYGLCVLGEDTMQIKSTGEIIYDVNNEFEEGERFYAPTQSLLQKWLLEEHSLFVSVELAYNDWGRFAANIQKPFKDDRTAILAIDGMTIFDNQYEALEEGLQEALKLI